MTAPPLPGGPYDIIYADPPWDFRNWSRKWHESHAESRWVGRQYGLLTGEELDALPVSAIASRDAVLFMWATFPTLPQAIARMAAWGFTYKTVAFVWVKRNRVADSFFTGMGFWTRSNAEVCLLGVKGKPLPRLRRDVRQIVYAPLRRHSQKPDEVRDRIVALLGDRPRIELFARERVAGWDAWGDEVANPLSNAVPSR